MVDHHADDTSEAAVLGALLDAALLDPAAAPALLADTPDPADYANIRHAIIATHIAKAATDGEPFDPESLIARLIDSGDLKPGYVDGTTIHALVEARCPPAAITWHTERIRRAAALRRTHNTLLRAQQRLSSADPDSPLDALVDLMDDVETTLKHEIAGHHRYNPITVETIDEVLAGDDDPYDWIVPGLLERADRLILTGPEGGGKSTLLRQLAHQLAAGLHPFTGEIIPPLRVLYVDLENSRRQFRRKARPLRVQLGDLLNPDQLRVSFRLDGLDLTSPDDVAWLDRRVATIAPDLLVTGPIYKLANGDPLEEKSAKPVAYALDQLRARYGTAVILEAHSAKATGGSKKRAHEPYGWSGWLRWPEFGIWLSNEGDIEHWRGMRDERDFPTILQRGGDWPWTAAESDSAARWARIRQCILTAGRKLTEREIAEATGMPKTTVHRVLLEYSMHWEALIANLDRKADTDEN